MADPWPYPLLLAPRFLPKPWGGRRMETVLGRVLPGGASSAEPIGESWEVHDRAGASSVVRNGRLAGRALHEIRAAAGIARPYPLLVKILDATERLSLQVHPDAAAASRIGGGAEAKTECWFVLDAAPGARVWRGLRDGITRASFEEALREGRVEECLHSFEVKRGDTVFVPAGTVHTIGAGVLLAEVQQNSDTTFRLHDWGRPRELHVAEAMESIRFGPRSPDTVPAQVIDDDGPVQRILLVRCPYFAVESVVGMGTFTLEVEPGVVPGVAPIMAPRFAPDVAPDAMPRVLHILAGSGELHSWRRRAAPVPFAPGDTLLLPPGEESFEVAPGATVVRALLATPGDR